MLVFLSSILSILFLEIKAIQGLALNQAALANQLGASANSDDCSSVVEVVESLTTLYPCLKDYYASTGCGDNNQSSPTQPPATKPPATQPPATQPPATQPPATQPPATQPTNEPIVAPSGGDHFGSYVPNWFVYRKHYMGIPKLNQIGQAVSPEEGINDYQLWGTTLRPVAPKLTHIYYAFWDLTKDCIVQDFDSDASWYGAFSDASWINIPNGTCKGLMNDLMSLKNEYPHLTMLISIGGWTCSRFFTTCAATADTRKTFYKSIAYRLNEMDSNWGKANAIWNGLDLDWEFPESDTGLYPDHSENDYANFIQLFSDIRSMAKAEGRDKIVLSSAVGVGGTLTALLAKPTVAKQFCDVQDHLNIMEYDLWGKWAQTTGHNANFCVDSRSGNPNPVLTVQSTMEGLLGAGCDPKKLILGVPSYSHAWTHIPAGPYNNGLFTDSTSSEWIGWGTFSDSDSQLIPQGIISYWDLKKSLAQYSDLKVYTMTCPADAGVQIPVKHIYSSSKQAFASYEDPETVEKKAQWAKNKGLGGLFIWDAQSDREGDIIDAARKGFGTTATVSAGGSPKCFDSSKPDYTIDPLTGQAKKTYCQFTNHSVTLTASLNTCYLAKQHSLQVCSGKSAIFIGGYHSGMETDCVEVCTTDWSAGKVQLWAGDTLFFACDGDTIPDAGTGGGSTGGGSTGGGNTGGGNTGGGGSGQTPARPQTEKNSSGDILDCYDCSTCVKNSATGANGVTDSSCASCIGQKDVWWPCTNGLCVCTA